MGCIWIDLISWVCEEREESRDNKEKCVVDCSMTITNFQMVFLGFSPKNSPYNFVGNEDIYDLGERGEDSNKITVVRAFHESLAS